MRAVAGARRVAPAQVHVPQSLEPNCLPRRRPERGLHGRSQLRPAEHQHDPVDPRELLQPHGLDALERRSRRGRGLRVHARELLGASDCDGNEHSPETCVARSSSARFVADPQDVRVDLFPEPNRHRSARLDHWPTSSTA